MRPISDYLLVMSEIKSEKEGDLIDFSLLCQVSDRQVFISLLHATSRGACVYDSNQDLGFFSCLSQINVNTQKKPMAVTCVDHVIRLGTAGHRAGRATRPQLAFHGYLPHSDNPGYSGLVP